MVGVTRRYDRRGLLPASRDELFKPYRIGERYEGVTSEEFSRHIEEFRKRCEISYPLLIGTQEDFRNYHVSNIPTTFVIDRRGVIRYIAVGRAKLGLITHVVDDLLVEDVGVDRPTWGVDFKPPNSHVPPPEAD